VRGNSPKAPPHPKPRDLLGTPKAARFQGRNILLLTGASFAPILAREAARLNRKTGARLRVAAAQNFSFGDMVTVAGLLCGSDLKYAAHADREGERDVRPLV